MGMSMGYFTYSSNSGTAWFSRGETKKDPKIPDEDRNETLIDIITEMVDMDAGCVYDGTYDLV